MAITTHQLIGQLLIEAGKIEQDQLNNALISQEDSSEQLGEILIEEGAVSKKEFFKLLSYQLKIPLIELDFYKIDTDLIELVSEKIARKYKVLPLFKIENTISLAVSDPLDPDPINAVQIETGLNIDPIISTKSDIENAIDMHYGISSFVDSDVQSDQTDISELFDESKIVELVNGILDQSNKYKSSDIHIEAREKDVRLRFRIDGKLQDFQKLPRDIFPALVSRIKIMSNMD
ncbi:MAG: hypothetical protein CMP35_03520, partial [Rickettsiales bacterium]|nr:hypothetical protein [Rickettsiales bacterium]